MTGPLFDCLTVRDVAAMHRVHIQTVRAWIRSGKLHRIGDRGPRGAWRIRIEEAEDLALVRGIIKPKYRTGDLVVYTDTSQMTIRLAQVVTYRPSMGYLVDLGANNLRWVPESQLYLSKAATTRAESDAKRQPLPAQEVPSTRENGGGQRAAGGRITHGPTAEAPEGTS